MPKYRKRPVTVDAIFYTGGNRFETPEEPWLTEARASGKVTYTPGETPNKSRLHIHTLEGVMTCNPGDYLLRGVDGEIYPCAGAIFRKTYDKT